MKKKTETKWKRLCLPLMGMVMGMVMGFAQLAHAEIPVGYFEGHDAKLWIKHVIQKNGQPGTYAMLLHSGDKGAKAGGQMFRVDELADGTQMWMQLFQNSGGLLQFGSEPTYSGTGFIEGRTPHLVLAVTDFGEKIGCTERVEVHSESGPAWVEIPANGARKIEGPHDDKGLIDAGKFTGHFVLDGRSYDGTYELAPIFPGAVLMHRVTVSRDAIDGHEVKREVTALVVVLFHNRCILPNYDDYEFVSLPPGTEMCLAPVEQLGD